MPPTMPVINPAATGTPEAIAMPMHSGSATRKAAIEEGMSNFSVEKKPLVVESFAPISFKLQYVGVIACDLNQKPSLPRAQGRRSDPALKPDSWLSAHGPRNRSARNS